VRVNPGNIRKFDDQVGEIAAAAKAAGVSLRIGVNAGSLDDELVASMMNDNARLAQPRDAREVWFAAMVESAVRSAEAAEELGLAHDRIVISCKVSRVPELVEVYTRLATRTDHPLHLGLTEAGMGMKGLVASSAALAVLLQRGIGDTIRVSLTPTPGAPRTEEVRAAQNILQALEIRPFMPTVTACPGCGRTTSDYFLRLSRDIELFLTARMPEWKQRTPRAAELKVAVMGCVVNGPGESRAAHLGISLPGTGEAPRSPVYVDGVQVTTLEGPTLVDDFKALIEQYVSRMASEHTPADRSAAVEVGDSLPPA